VVGTRSQRQIVPAYAFAHAAKKLCRLGRIRASAPNNFDCLRACHVGMNVLAVAVKGDGGGAHIPSEKITPYTARH
jgi:hypothetical protein